MLRSARTILELELSLSRESELKENSRISAVILSIKELQSPESRFLARIAIAPSPASGAVEVG